MSKEGQKVEGFPPQPHGDDDYDDLAALDFLPDDAGAATGLDALDDYAPFQAPSGSSGGSEWEASDEGADEGSGELESPVFVATNPPGTITVGAYLDGRVEHVDLSAKVTTMTESNLAEEIVVTAGLARDKARSAQYAFISEIMRELGQEPAETHEFVGRAMGLPSPTEVQAKEADVFANWYASPHE